MTVSRTDRKKTVRPAKNRTGLSIESILEGSPIPTFVIDRNHKIILWNKACAELTGYHARNMIGTDHHYKPLYPEKRPLIADLIVDQDIEGSGDILRKETGAEIVRHRRGLRSDGFVRRTWVENRAISTFWRRRFTTTTGRSSRPSRHSRM